MLISVAQAQQFFLAFTRIMAMLMAVPMLGSQSIPAQVRISLGVILTAVLIPWQPIPESNEALGLFAMAAGVFNQLLIGLMASMAATLVFGAIQIAGEMMGIGSGFGSGRLFNPTLGETGTAVDQLFIMVGMLIFVILDGHHGVIRAVQQSFVYAPLNAGIPFTSPEKLIVLTAKLIATGIQISLPVMVAIFLADLSLGLLARVAPQVQVYFLGLPLKIGLGMIVFSLSFGIALPTMQTWFDNLGPTMLELVSK
jgi:flagellar biosynthesis protein FliR